MGRADYWKPGDPSAICDRCGFKFKLSQLKKEWDGLMVCDQCWEPRQPQDFVRGVKDQRPIPDARPETPDQYVSGTTNVPSGVTQITVGASPFSFTNNTNLAISVEITGGVVSLVQIGGLSAATSSEVTVVLSPKQIVTVTYSSLPVMFY